MVRPLPISRLAVDLTRDAELQDHALDLRFDLLRFDPRIAFTRSSTASYFDADGIFRVAAANTPRFDYDPATKALKGFLVEEGRTNLLTYSSEFANAAWTMYQARVVPNGAVSPDGTMSADKLAGAVGTTNEHSLSQIYAYAANTTYTYSAFLKTAEVSAARLWVSTGSVTGGGNAHFNLATGAVIVVNGTGIAATITNAGNGWYRCTMTFTTHATPSASGVRIDLGNVSGSAYTPDGSNGLYIWGAQLETGAFATSHIPTTPTFTSRASAATYFDAQGVLRIAGRNLQTYSEQFDNAVWTKGLASVTASATGGPGGATNGAKIAETAGTGVHTLQFVTLASGAYRVSMSLKAAERGFAFIGNAADHAVTVNLTTGVITSALGAPSSMRCESQGDGWWRVSFVATYPASAGIYLYLSSDGVFANRSYAGVAGSGIYAWGAQISEGAWEAPYVSTTSAAVGVARTGYGYTGTAWVSKGLELEAAATNLLIYSNDFRVTTGWSNSVNGSVIRNNVDVAPDGTLSASYITTPGVTNQGVFQTVTVAENTTYTFSFWAKRSAETEAWLRVYNNTGSANITSRNYYSEINATGYTRVSQTFTTPAGCTSIRVYVQADLGSAALKGAYLWGAQLETGAVATSYIPTTPTFTSRSSTATYVDSTGLLKTAALNEARYGYGFNGTAWVSKGLELEAAATNLAFPSNASNTQTPTRASFADSGQLFIDGTSAFYKLAEDTTASNTHMGTVTSRAVAASTTYTASYYVKAAGRSIVQLHAHSAASWSPASPVVEFDLTAKTVTTRSGSATGRIEDCGNGVFRISITAKTGASGFNSGFYPVLCSAANTTSYTGDGTSGILIGGYQFETGSVATSYIPTTSASVTRAADVSSSVTTTRAADVSSSAATTRAADTATISGSNFLGWFNATEGTLFADFYTSAFGATQQVAISVNDGTGNERMLVRRENATQALSFVMDGGVMVASFTLAAPFGRTAAALAYKLNDSVAAVNGVLGTVDTACTLPATTQLQIGNHLAAMHLNGHIKRLTYYPRRLSNAKLQQAST